MFTNDNDQTTKKTQSVKPSKSQAREDALNEMFSGQPAIDKIAPKLHSYTSVNLAQLVPHPSNTRIGQTELVESLPSLQQALKKEVNWPDSLPLYHEMKNKIQLSPEAIELFNDCIVLANSFVNGHANEAIKVFPTEKVNGKHIIFTGNRRYIAYNLLQPFTGINSIDVIVGRTVTDPVSSAAHIERMAENNVKKANSAGEQLRSLNYVIEALKSEGKSVDVPYIIKHTGLDRTQCIRMVKILDSNLTEEMFTYIHVNKLNDIPSLEMIFTKPQDHWYPMLNQLKEHGPTTFRTAVRLEKETNPNSTEKPKYEPGQPKPDFKNIGSAKILDLIKTHKPEWYNGPIEKPSRVLAQLIKKLSIEG